MWLYSWNGKGMSTIKFTNMKYNLYYNNLQACKKRENKLRVCLACGMHNKNDKLLLLAPN